jgi:hypothetical protein
LGILIDEAFHPVLNLFGVLGPVVIQILETEPVFQPDIFDVLCNILCKQNCN